jgi:hypothetical protein
VDRAQEPKALLQPPEEQRALGLEGDVLVVPFCVGLRVDGITCIRAKRWTVRLGTRGDVRLLAGFNSPVPRIDNRGNQIVC